MKIAIYARASTKDKGQDTGNQSSRRWLRATSSEPFSMGAPGALKAMTEKQPERYAKLR
jgi:hypothetical protein